jgi:hypothetical protein
MILQKKDIKFAKVREVYPDIDRVGVEVYVICMFDIFMTLESDVWRPMWHNLYIDK